MTENNRERVAHFSILLCAIIVFIWSSFMHQSTFDWCFLSLPVVIIILILVGTYQQFRFTTFTYAMMLIYLVMLMIGTTYTYTANPQFQFLKEWLNLSRNHYDRLTHLAFGFFPIFILKEFLFRKNYLVPRRMSYAILLLILLAFAALWELLEFGATIVSNRSAAYMLSLQGDSWDTQWDMLLALIGACLALLFLDKFHQKMMIAYDNKNRKSASLD